MEGFDGWVGSVWVGASPVSWRSVVRRLRGCMSVSVGLGELWAMCMVDVRRLITRKREHDERRIAMSSDLCWSKE